MSIRTTTLSSLANGISSHIARVDVHLNVLDMTVALVAVEDFAMAAGRGGGFESADGFSGSAQGLQERGGP
ncbi:MAG: hypothetical protein M1830_008104 [Pleopsidium flavum]|nr:MAG: hypothetical protein M1830_008104 [Pleopsidium flavum]